MKQIQQQASDKKLPSREQELDLRTPKGRTLPY
jgi:hypothetical protein